MKQQQQISSKRQSQNSNAIELSELTPISQLISRSLLRTNYNKLIFTSNAISMIKPIAWSYLSQYPEKHQSANIQVLLIDFSETEIDYLQQTLKAMALANVKRKIFQRDIVNHLNIIKLSNQPIQKRKIGYLKAGIYSVSSQIFLTDLLRGWNQLHTLKIKIIVKFTEKILSHYHYHAWLTTILKIRQYERNKEESNVSFIYICNRPQYYGDFNQLSRIYRTFFCKKIIIWPFGRAQIHKALGSYRQKNIFKQWQHVLSMSEGERQINQALMELYYFLKKKMLNKTQQKINNSDHILYSCIVEDGYNFTKGQYTEFQHIKLLLLHLQNSNKITVLNTITKFIQLKDCQIWNSNNSEAITIIENILQQLQSAIFNYQNQSSSNNLIDLISLFRNLQGTDVELNIQKQLEYTCKYPLALSLLIKPQVNQKLNEVIKIIQNIKDSHRQQKQNEEDESNRHIQDVLIKNGKQQQAQQYHNVLIMCGAKGVQRFIKDSLQAYLTSNSYLNYIRNLYRFLKGTRSLRMKKIKKIYDRKKVRKSQGNQSKKGDKNSWTEENKIILKQMLFQQLQRINEILINFELQLQIINQQSKKPMNSQVVFQLNKQESKLIQNFHQNLLSAAFKIIDINQIKSSYISSKINKIIFDSNNTKKRIFVDCENNGVEPNYFYQLLNNINPSTVIFYTPSPLLLRSLYLYQLENNIDNLHQIHVLSYQDSYQTKKASFQVTKQDKAFWNISQSRSQLPQFIQSPFLRIKNINFRDSIEEARNQFNSKNIFRSEQGQNSISKLLTLQQTRRKILVDTRQFKSSLPSYLYHLGFDIIPVFLKTADYILADDIAIEKKSIHTKDLHNSIKSLRLDEQLRKMSAHFRHPYLLIQCQEESDFIKSNFGFIDGTSGNKSRYQLRKKIMQLLHKYQNVRIIWSASVEQSCQFIRQLKQDKHDPDISKYVKQQGEQVEQKSQRGSLGRISQTTSNKQQQQQQIILK